MDYFSVLHYQWSLFSSFFRVSDFPEVLPYFLHFVTLHSLNVNCALLKMILGIISLDASRRSFLVFEYVVILEFKLPKKVDHNIVKLIRNGFPAVKMSSVLLLGFSNFSICRRGIFL